MIHAYVRLVAARSGVNPDDIRVAPMAPASMLAAFQSKQIDGYAMSLPWPQKAVQDGEALLDRQRPGRRAGRHDPVRPQPDRDQAGDLREAQGALHGDGPVDQGRAAFIKGKPDEAFALLKKRFPTLDDKLLKASFEELQKVTPSPPLVSKAIIENSEKFNVDAGLLKADEKLKSYDGLFTNDYVQ